MEDYQDEVIELATKAAIQLHKCYNWSQFSDHYSSTSPMQEHDPRSIIGNTMVRLKGLAWKGAEATGLDFESVYNEIHLEFVRNELKIMTQELPLDPREAAMKVVTATKEDGESCGVCQFEFEIAEEVSKTTPCKHMFHGLCLWKWLYDHNTCPLCRTVLFE